MSYETDRLHQEINQLKWQKAENYKLEALVIIVIDLKEKIIKLENEKSYLQERIQTLEDRLNNQGV
mgnify:CR=1 FL=1|jgi:myo-inositol catabolism protein IolC